MKKILSVVCAILLLALCMLPACAVGGGQMQITTSCEVEYQLAFPADTEIPWEAAETDIGSVVATKMLIEPFKVVKVSVSSENSFALVNTEDTERAIAYTLLGADGIVFCPGEIGRAFPITAVVSAQEWAQAASGEHKDTLTFMVEYADA